jgi:hypothetical protein
VQSAYYRPKFGLEFRQNLNGIRVTRFTSTIELPDYSAGLIPIPGSGRSPMAALSRVLAHALPRNSSNGQFLNELAFFCTAGLYVSLLLIKYGVTLSYGLF